MNTVAGIINSVNEQEVTDYLRAHPDFFDRHAPLLAELNVPHDSGNSVSLIERQVAVLREQNRNVRHELNELVQIARENDRLIERLQRLTLALMETQTLAEVLLTTHDILRIQFNADLVAVRLFSLPSEPVPEGTEHHASSFGDDLSPDRDTLSTIINAGKSVCGKLGPAQLQYLFRAQATGIVSSAVIPLHRRAAPGLPEQCFGLLAIGSLNADRFHPAMGTLFLGFMGIIVGRALAPHLQAG